MASLRNMSRKDKGDRITYESLWIHAKRHYDISGVAAYWRTRMVNEFRNALGGARTPIEESILGTRGNVETSTGQED
jgi:hypothetical protein